MLSKMQDSGAFIYVSCTNFSRVIDAITHVRFVKILIALPEIDVKIFSFDWVVQYNWQFLKGGNLYRIMIGTLTNIK